ncbi:glycosyltransferase [Rhodophyticola sp. CCM32]|uniref:glycosyltransferase n=1 Tax=Rhodophyticola sp. CCM32 TaxID=2916397 RepID=UPI00107FA78C|nr:glycosyltransferase [Rhodophyticola sp. CCM32]QBX99598.1 glycosyltransferase [Rhodophyticola sp. CCM32]
MISSLQSVFRRYVDQHIITRVRGFPLGPDPETPLGYVDFYDLTRDHVHMVGWCLASRVVLGDGRQSADMRPNIARPDVTGVPGMPDHQQLGFELRLPRGNVGLTITTIADGLHYDQPVPGPGGLPMAMARLGLLPGFLGRLARSLPLFLRWRLTNDDRQRGLLRSALALDDRPSHSTTMPDRLFLPADTPPRIPPATPVTLILPIHNAFSLLPEMLDRVLRHTDLPFRLIVIEDCSTDLAVRPFLRHWRDGLGPGAPVELIENRENLGFVGSVNLGLQRADTLGNHIILLNSDALVPEGWASRLLRPICEDETVASVTPMSNDAEIYSVPLICQPSTLAPGQAEAIDRVARRLTPGITQGAAPTAVGFCMAINHAYLARVPQFDTGFGRGYGEEVDWCQKVKALGGRHLGLSGLFVEHRGGESFGQVQKQELLRQSGIILTRRYPRFDADVQNFIAADPLAAGRVALAIAWAASLSPDPLPIYLAHSLGGGAETCLEREITRHIATGTPIIVLRVGSGPRMQVDLHTGRGRITGAADSLDLVADLLACIPARHVIYSCGVGDRDPASLPGFLTRLKRGAQDRLEILFHDFFPLSPSYVLLGDDGRFAGLPARDTISKRHSVLRADGRRVLLGEWRALWGEAISAADQLTVFSQSSRALVARAYPGMEARIRVKPHEMPDMSPLLSTARPGPRPVLGVLGDIGLQKGAAVISDLCAALDGQNTRPFDLAIIGNFDSHYPLPDWVTVHGRYACADIPDLVARYHLSHWLIPSVWPETFSFTTHEALATGLPVICFDLGAQAEALCAAGPPHHILPMTDTAQLITNLSAVICRTQEGITKTGD